MSRELDERCAKALGIEGAVNGRPCYFVPGHVNAFFVPPAFSTDHGWARMLEDEVEKRGLVGAYFRALKDTVVAEVPLLPEQEFGYAIWRFIRATPEQKARAFLKAVGA